MRQAWLWVVAAVLLAGCGDSSGPPPIEVEGQWSGSIGQENLSLTVQETSGALAGSGSLNNGTDAVAVTVTGTFTRPSVAIVLHADGFNDIDIQGNVGETSLTGSANGSGYVNATVNLTRH
jgi:hypothetical protein